MKLNPTILITSGITALVCGSIYMMRAKSNAELEEELLGQRSKVEKLEREVRKPGGRAARSGRDQTVVAIARSRAETTSAERVERAHTRVEALLADVGNFSASPDQLFRILPDIFRLLKNLDVDELIAVSDKIDAPLVFGQQGGGKGAVKIILLLLAGEEEPERVLNKIVNEGEPQALPTALATLTRKNPRAAMSWIQSSDFSETERSELMKMVTMRALNSDFEAGLEMLRQDENFDLKRTMALFAQIPISVRTLDQAVATLRRPENAGLDSGLTNLVLNSTMFNSGVEGAREAVRKYELPKEEVAAYLRDTGARFSQSDPAGTIEWMMEVQPVEEQKESIPMIVKRWTNRDYKSVAKFLDGMDPSPVRDLSTENFAKSVVDLDPEAAAIWALQIGNADARQSTIKFVADKWGEKDQAAASAWLEKQGIEVE